MAGASQDAMANRDEPIPVLKIPSKDDLPIISGSESDARHRKRDKIRDKAGKLKDKLEEYAVPETRHSLQDRLLNGIMSQIIPPEDLSEVDEVSDSKSHGTKDRRSRRYVDRPGFSIQAMSSNFRRFNARVGVVFVLQNRLIRLFTWHHPTATVSFLAIYTLLCLQPHLLPVLPVIGLIFWILVPSFLARHPAPANDPRVEPSYRGPPLAPASHVKPVPEMSKDFFRNMRDLQNSMEDFSRLHDAAIEWVTPYTNFSDEGVSTMLFVALFGLSCAGFIGCEIVPWRVVALLGGWAMILSGHPEAQKMMLSSRNVSQLSTHGTNILAKLRHYVHEDIILNSPPELRQVEVFELQKFHLYSSTWEPWLFSPSPYDPLSPARIAGARAKGTQFFEDVQAPKGWSWKDKKWRLDLESREWVEERMIVGVEVEVEGERWVYDFPPEEVEALEGASGTGKKAAVKKKGKEVPRSGWEEGTGSEVRGEWRRRRWVRLVERRPKEQKPK